MKKETRIFLAQRLLYCVYGIVPIVAGLDKYFSYITDWTMYLNASIPNMLGVTLEQLVMVSGVIEIAAGALVLFRPKIGAYVVSAWLVVIAINLVSMGMYYDIAIRDIALAAGAYALALLS
jgi:uncharacterized membrane protein HdeD (DUF308 family)